MFTIKPKVLSNLHTFGMHSVAKKEKRNPNSGLHRYGLKFLT